MSGPKFEPRPVIHFDPPHAGKPAHVGMTTLFPRETGILGSHKLEIDKLGNIITDEVLISPRNDFFKK